MKPIKETEIESAFVRAINRLVAERDRFLAVTNTSIEFASAKKKATSADALRKQLAKAQADLIEASNNKRSDVTKLIEQIDSIQRSLEIARITDKEADIYLLKMNEAKKLLNQPLAAFNDIVFRSMVERVIVLAEETKPVALRFILSFGKEITEQLV